MWPAESTADMSLPSSRSPQSKEGYCNGSGGYPQRFPMGSKKLIFAHLNAFLWIFFLILVTKTGFGGFFKVPAACFAASSGGIRRAFWEYPKWVRRVPAAFFRGIHRVFCCRAKWNEDWGGDGGEEWLWLRGMTTFSGNNNDTDAAHLFNLIM